MTNLTKSTKPIKEVDIKRNWHLIDVSGKVLGRIAPEIARLLQGKHKVTYVPYLDVGDHVVVTNAKNIVITGRKASSKVYTRYSGYPGGLRTISYKNMLADNPAQIIIHAVSGMLPKNKLRDQRLKRLYVFAGAEHNFKDKFV